MSGEMKPCEISNEDNTLKLTTCGTCEGFYGNNYGQPVCSTCHYFLYNSEDLQEDFQREKTDSGDSGNEEPQAAEDFYPARLENCAVYGFVDVFDDGDYAEAQRDLNLVQTPLQARSDHLTRYSTYHKWNTNKDNSISFLPNEVLSKILKFVNSDAVSLLRARSTCSLWQTVIDRITPETYWQAAVRSYWPIFCAAYKVSDWKIMFACLLKSSTCVLCLKEMMTRRKETTDKKQLMWRSRRLSTERKMLDEEPPEGIKAVPLDENMCHWQATINGPDGSVYEGGVFYLHLKVGFDYPVVPPRVRFITKIFHPNISRHGEVGIDLWPNWSLVLTIGKVLVSVQSLLTDPYCFVSMEPKISRLHEDDRPEFDRIAREWTKKYARWTHTKPNWQSNVCFL